MLRRALSRHAVRSFAVLLGFAAVLAAAPPDGWTWTDREERTLAKLERAVDEENGRFELSESRSWRVDTPGSARLAAELSLFLTMLEEVIVDLTGEKREVGAYPTVLVLAPEAMRERAGSSRGVRYRYAWKADARGSGIVQKRVTENHLYVALEGDVEGATLDVIDLDALRGEGTRAILCGMFGQQHTSAWFEEGTVAFLSTWDLHVRGRDIDDEAFAARRERSRTFASALAAFDPESPPSFQALLAARHQDFARKRLVDGMSNDAAAESLIDALFTSRRARSVRKDVLKEISRAAARSDDVTLLERSDVSRLERAWHAHMESLVE